MLRLQTSPVAESLRTDFRAWLKDNRPPQPKDHSLDAFIETGRSWQRMLAKGKWLAVHWPENFGGRSQDLVSEAVIQEELVRAEAPQLLGLFGLTMVGPVLIQYGTEEQKKKYLSKILRADDIWCQGFSEPNAGSDLAAIKTRGTPTKGGYLVSGQKTWTSFAQIADFCFLLCRTSEAGKKHQGLTYLLVDMKSKGITSRPLRQISGDDEFNEVFFDEVFVPNENVVGKEGDGWSIAISTLMYERVILTFARQIQSEVALRNMIARFSDHPSEALKTKLAEEVVKACAVRALSYKHLSEYADGKTPGPEGSLDKLFWSESFQSLSKLALGFLGIEAASSENSAEYGADIHRYLYSRGRTIAAGTSEIQRNIIAERLLKLPRAR